MKTPGACILPLKEAVLRARLIRADRPKRAGAVKVPGRTGPPALSPKRRPPAGTGRGPWLRKSLAIGGLALLFLLGGCADWWDGGDSGAKETGTEEPAPDEPPDDEPPPSGDLEAAFEVEPEEGLAPVTVQLDAGPSSGSRERIVSFRWQFPGNEQARGEQVRHRFPPGSHEVRLTVTDEAGRQASRTRTLTYADKVQLSGTATGPGFLVLDSDVNNPELYRRPNDGVSEAQALPNPAVVGGYVTAEPTDESGDVFDDEADKRDIYQLQLAEGQGITLYVSDHREADPDRVDLDLGIFAPSDLSQPAASSVDVTATESLTVPEGNTYYLVVEAANGASPYNLVIGSQNLAAGVEGPRLRAEGDFIPGEVVADCTSEALAGVRESTTGSFAGMDLADGGNRRGPQLLRVRTGEGADPGLAGGIRRQESPARTRTPGRLGAGATVSVVKALRGRPGCRYAAPNYRRRALLTPDDPYFGEQWALPQLRLPEAWEIGTGGESPLVAVVDTGRVAHPDLAGRFTGTGYDFIADPELALDGDGIDADPTDPGDPDAAGGASFHGTHVAGTIAAVGDNTQGVSGVLWEGRLMALRALSPRGGTSYDMMQAVRYAAGLSNDSGTTPPEPADVINLSLGGGAFSQAEADLFKTLHERGVFVAAAAGNQGEASVTYPAGYDQVIGVGAVDRSGDLAPYSNTGSHVALVAPGGNLNEDADGDGRGDGILSTWAVDGEEGRQFVYAYLEGTSMAAPHVAGVIALMKEQYPELEPAELDRLLGAGSLTRDLGPSGKDPSYGHGLLDALASLRSANRLADGGALPPVLEAAPTSLDFGLTQQEQVLTLTNGGGGTLRIARLGSPAPWVTIEPAEVDAQGLGDYRVAVDRSGLSPGPYRSTVTVTTGAGDEKTIPLTLTVPRQDAVPVRPGKRYLLLIDSETGVSKQGRLVAPQNGSYPYAFDVGRGSYQILAGTDMDNDGVICDAGEACGAYPTLGDAREVTVVGGALAQGGLDFSASFRWNLDGTEVTAGGEGAIPPEAVHGFP